MKLSDYKHIYLVGIGGISVSAIARLARHHNITVSGFDVAESELTHALEKEGCTIQYTGDDTLPADVDLLVYSEAVPATDDRRVHAEENAIPQMSAFQFWGAFAKDKKVIAVSGTNGKSTTTAMVGMILEKAGLDPTVVVGTSVHAWNSNIRIGASEWLVIEADEYHAHMMEFIPHIACITNIAADHLDYYKDVADIVSHYQKWIDSMLDDGVVVVNVDDNNAHSLDAKGKRTIDYSPQGISPYLRPVCAVNRTLPDGSWGSNGYNLVDEKEDWGFVALQVPGSHNRANALAAAAVADALGIKHKTTIKALDAFTGTWRRFEKVGEYHGALIISDYGHHPDGVTATLSACREWFPFRRLVCVYQPHQHNRTKQLFADFVESFDEADVLIMAEIYDVAGRKEDSDADASSQQLVDAIMQRHSGGTREQHVLFAKDIQESESLAREHIQKDDVVIVMGAGDIDTVARHLVK